MQRSKICRSQKSLLVSFTAIAASLAASNHAVAAIVVGFGDNSYNQLGNNIGYSSDVPVFAQGLSNNVTGLASATYTTVVIDNGVVKAWGSGTLGELGNGVAANSTVPVNVTGLGTGVTQIASGITHVLAIQNGGVVSWGEGDDGEMGNGTTNFTNLAPVKATGLSTGVTAVAAGQWNSVAIQNGAVKMWGYGYATTPATIGGLTSNVTAISAGQQHDLAIQNGAAIAWGNGGNGELGNGTNGTSANTAVAVTGLSSGVTEVAAGSTDSLAIMNGNVYSWGSGAQGALGNNSTVNSNVPILVLDKTVDFVQVAAGESSSYALTADGQLYAWGYGIYGELGLGDDNNRYVPTLVPAPAGYVYTDIVAGPHDLLATIAPVPEPGTLGIAAVGVLGLLRRMRRASR